LGSSPARDLGDCAPTEQPGQNQHPWKQRALIAVVGLLVILPALGLLVVAWFVAHYLDAGDDEVLLARHVSPNGHWALVLRHEGPVWSARGPSSVSLYAVKTEKPGEKRLARFSVNNDGANLSSDACDVKWFAAGEAVAQVTCHGAEQTDDVWLVNLPEQDVWRLAGD
jgi:hypothetical protein